ncbi:MAG TPA: hypothetical protein VKB25_05295 [Conexibacter sp.]|nr:hypothetical protein [Conexibacter sp.]
MSPAAVRERSDYDCWNEAIVEEFFTGRYGGRPVYLDLEEEAMARIASSVGYVGDDPQGALVEAVRPTLDLASSDLVFKQHRRRLAAWTHADRSDALPVAAVLALLSLVAEQMRADEQFRASNYYGRLLRTLGCSPDDRRLRQRIVRCFADETHELWDGLNDWLAERPEVRGRPTAHAFDYRVHVGVPMSQALVRDADRVALRGLFVDSRLSPGERVAHSDMVRLLEAWVPSSPLSSALKRLCESREALQRIADVACIELEAWDGEGLLSAETSRRRLALVATLRRHPRPRLSLGVAASIGARDVRTLVLDDEAGSAAVAALGDAAHELAEPDERGWADAVDKGHISMSHLLVTVLRCHAGDLSLQRTPRRLVVLERDEGRRRFREVDRVRLGSECMLLAAASLGPQLEPALAEAARPGWRRYDADGLAGLPPGWCLLTGVEIVAATSSQHIDLSPLIPIAWTQLTLHGGLALPGHRTWLATAPPEVSGSSLSGEPALAVLVPEGAAARAPETDGEEEGDPLAALGLGARVLGQIAPAAIFDLAELALPAGSYRVTLLPADAEGAPLSSLRMRLLVAAGEEPADPLVHPLGRAPLAAISADAGDVGVRGAIAPSETIEDVVLEPEALPPTLGVWPVDELESDESDASVAVAHMPAHLPACMETGAHYFKLPPTSETAGQLRLQAMCEHCGIERFFPARPPRRWGGRGRRDRRDGLKRAAALPPLPPRRDDVDRLGVDHVLEALCVLGSGTWQVAQRIVEQVDDRPWATTEKMRALSALGHVDLMLNRSDLRGARWAVAPSALVAGAGGAFLAGWRSKPLLEALEQEAGRLGGRIQYAPQADAPVLVRVAELERAELPRLAATVAQRAGRRVEVALDVPRRLATLLPPLSELRAALPTVGMPATVELERFEPSSGRWERAEGGLHAGGYRSVALPRRLWHFNGRDWRVADDRLVKWLSAGRDALLAFDLDHHALACHLGAQLPGLYERAAVLCSGRLPQSTGTGHVVYPDVGPTLAAALGVCLASSRSPVEVA